MHVFIMRGIITKIQNCYFSADDEGISGMQTDGKKVRQLHSFMKTQCSNSRTADGIFTKFCMDVMPLESSPNSHFSISYNW
jgi:hypothetical protein